MKRNFSFKDFKHLPENKMTVVNDIRVPAVPGTCYHAILCGLIDSKNKFVTWEKLLKLVEKYLVMYGGEEAWLKFAYGSKRKNRREKKLSRALKKIKTNTHTLTRTGKNCYGYRLHVRGLAIYYFKDGVMIRTNGKFIPAKGRRPYNIKFKDGTQLQVRNRGKTMSYREYKDFVGSTWRDEQEKIESIN